MAKGLFGNLAGEGLRNLVKRQKVSASGERVIRVMDKKGSMDLAIDGKELSHVLNVPGGIKKKTEKEESKIESVEKKQKTQGQIVQSVNHSVASIQSRRMKSTLGKGQNHWRRVR